MKTNVTFNPKIETIYPSKALRSLDDDKILSTDKDKVCKFLSEQIRKPSNAYIKNDLNTLLRQIQWTKGEDWQRPIYNVVAGYYNPRRYIKNKFAAFWNIFTKNFHKNHNKGKFENLLREFFSKFDLRLEQENNPNYSSFKNQIKVNSNDSSVLHGLFYDLDSQSYKAYVSLNGKCHTVKGLTLGAIIDSVREMCFNPIPGFKI